MTPQEYKNKYMEERLGDFKAVCREVLSRNPGCFIAYQGYTPYFNDGDPCEHSYQVTLAPSLGEDGYIVRQTEGDGLFTIIEDVGDDWSGVDLEHVEPLTTALKRDGYIGWRAPERATLTRTVDGFEEVFGDGHLLVFKTNQRGIISLGDDGEIYIETEEYTDHD